LRNERVLRKIHVLPFLDILFEIEIETFKRGNGLTQLDDITPLFIGKPAVRRVHPLCSNGSAPHHQKSHFLGRDNLLLFLQNSHCYQNGESQFVLLQQRPDDVLEERLCKTVVYVLNTFESASSHFFHSLFKKVNIEFERKLIYRLNIGLELYIIPDP
jgi:hypothetical protein